MKFFFLAIIPLIISCNGNLKNSEQVKEVKKKDTATTNNFVDLDSIEVRRQRLLDTNYTFLNRLLDSSLRTAYKQGFEQPFQ